MQSKLVRDAGVADGDLEIGGTRRRGVGGDLIRDIRREGFGEPAGLIDLLAGAVEEGDAIVDVKLAIGRGANGKRDVQEPGGIATYLRLINCGVSAQIF